MSKYIDFAICDEKIKKHALDMVYSNFKGTLFEAKFDEFHNHISGFLFENNKISVKSIPPQKNIEDIIVYSPTGDQILRYEFNGLTVFFEPGIAFLSIFDKGVKFKAFLKYFDYQNNKLYMNPINFIKNENKRRKKCIT